MQKQNNNFLPQRSQRAQRGLRRRLLSLFEEKQPLCVLCDLCGKKNHTTIEGLTMQIIGGKYKNRKILSPKGDQTRPTSARLREALFNICQSSVEGASFLDLFAGSGAMGLEALSRGAIQVTFVDNHKECLRAIEASVASFAKGEKVEALYGDVFQYIEKLLKRGKQYNIIYADPPYESYQTIDGNRVSYSTRIVELIDKSTLLAPGGQLFVEDAINSQPLIENLSTLTLISSRRLGRSVLLEYEKKA